MNDPKIVIDASHGGSDTGNTGNGIIEKDLALKISQYMERRFQELGVPVTMVRNGDETVSNEERIRRILDAYGNGNNVIVISNHINSGGDDGAEVVYALRNNSTLANQISQELELAGQNVLKAYQRRLPGDTSKDYYFIHRDTANTQPIMIEYGYLDSTKDDVNQLKNNYESYAEAVVKAVMAYIGKGYQPEVGENQYVVKSGDSLWSIANRYGITVDELKKANNLTSSALQVGQVLTIPGKTPSQPETPPQTNQNIYIVKSGDSLWSIANRYGTTVDEIKRKNGLTSNALQVGQTLYLPESGSNQPENVITYTVKNGDSLYTIARAYQTTVNELMAYNGLKTNLLQIGQVLKIPTGASQNIYTVKSGDSLWSIANRYGTTVDEIKRKNNLTSNALQIGQKLII